MAVLMTTKTGIYVHPHTFGNYSGATITYIGERNDIDNMSFEFGFVLRDNQGRQISLHSVNCYGETLSGNTIKDEGLLSYETITSEEVVIPPDPEISGDTGSTITVTGITIVEKTFVEFIQGGGDIFNDPYTIIRYPELSYTDIDTYMILGAKKEKVKLPTNSNIRSFMKWYFLNRLDINMEWASVQFEFLI